MGRPEHVLVGWEEGIVQIRLPPGELPERGVKLIEWPISRSDLLQMVRLCGVVAMRNPGRWEVFLTAVEYDQRYHDEVPI